MSKEQRAHSAGEQAPRVEEAPGGDTREELRHRMGEARESISQTVAEIRDSVTDKYQSVVEGVEGALDWREQFRGHPVAWCVGALAVGYVVGNSVAAGLKGGTGDDRLLSQLSTLGDRFADELSEHGMKILTPVLSGAVLVPIIIDKVGELSGVDLSGLAAQLTRQEGGGGKAPGKGKKKKAGGKKHGKKGKSAKRGAAA